VELASGEAVGEVVALYELPQGLTLEVRRPTTRRARALPRRDRGASRSRAAPLVLSPPEGLLDDERAGASDWESTPHGRSSEHASPVTVVTRFHQHRHDLPRFFEGPLGLSIPARAAAAGAVRYRVVDLREHTHDRHRTVDDYPYGGGPAWS
jgi:hypothetical protein